MQRVSSLATIHSVVHVKPTEALKKRCKVEENVKNFGQP